MVLESCARLWGLGGDGQGPRWGRFRGNAWVVAGRGDRPRAMCGGRFSALVVAGSRTAGRRWPARALRASRGRSAGRLGGGGRPGGRRRAAAPWRRRLKLTDGELVVEAEALGLGDQVLGDHRDGCCIRRPPRELEPDGVHGAVAGRQLLHAGVLAGLWSMRSSTRAWPPPARQCVVRAGKSVTPRTGETTVAAPVALRRCAERCR
jgi:hypothetical protein